MDVSLIADYGFWTLVAVFGLWTPVAVFEFWTLVAIFLDLDTSGHFFGFGH